MLHDPSPRFQDWLRTNRPDVYEQTTYTCIEISQRMAAQQYETVGMSSFRPYVPLVCPSSPLLPPSPLIQPQSPRAGTTSGSRC